MSDNQPREITKIKLGPILLDCTTAEEVTKNADVTERPIEKGEDISDHMKTKPYAVRLSGMMVNDAENKISAIEEMMKEAELLEYIGKRKLKDMVVTSFATKQNKQVVNGYDWDISLKSVKIAKPQSIKQKTKNPETKKQDKKMTSKVKEKTNAGRKQLQNTQGKNTDYTNVKSNPSTVNRQKPLNGSGAKNLPTRQSINTTKPVQVRNKMLGSLTNGTKVRAGLLKNKGGER